MINHYSWENKRSFVEARVPFAQRDANAEANSLARYAMRNFGWEVNQ